MVFSLDSLAFLVHVVTCMHNKVDQGRGVSAMIWKLKGDAIVFYGFSHPSLVSMTFAGPLSLLEINV